MADDGLDDDELETVWELFEQESDAYLAQMESGLSGSLDDLLDAEVVGGLFRAFHSLKGVSASLHLLGIEAIAHRGEDLLDLFRNGQARPDEAARDVLLQCVDLIVSMREDCLATRSDTDADPGILDALARTKTRMLASGSPAPAAQPATEPLAGLDSEALELDDIVLDSEFSGPAIVVSTTPASPDEEIFQAANVGSFVSGVVGELNTIAEILGGPAGAPLDLDGLREAIDAMRAKAGEAEFLGLADALLTLLLHLDDGMAVEKTSVVKHLCDVIQRLVILSELSGSEIATEHAKGALSAHISKEARDVLDRLEADIARTEDWELLAVLSVSLGVRRISALARLASELTADSEWRQRGDATAVVREIRDESLIVGVEGLDVSTLDMESDVYDKIRENMALLLTSADASVAALSDQLDADTFNSLSPSSREEIARFLEHPGAILVEVRTTLPEDGGEGSSDLMSRLFEENVVSNRVRADTDPPVFEFLICTDAAVADFEASMRGGDGLLSCKVLIQADGQQPSPENAPPGQAKALEQGPSVGAGSDNVLFFGEDAWNDAVATGEAGPGGAATEPLATPPSPVPASVSPPVVTPKPKPGPEPAVAELDEPVDVQPASASARSDRTETPARTGRATPGGDRNLSGASLRVSAELVDNYLDSVAELRLCLSRLEQGAAEAGFANTSAELRSVASQTGARKAERLRNAARQIDDAGKVISGQIVRAESTLRLLHSVTLQLRVVPIGIVLNRMPRLVRDLARNLGKKVDLHIEDGDIQIDKAMVDALMEPMVHMIRNAMDHGIETPDERQGTGKDETATLTLEASQNGSEATIMIADDGRGLDTDRIRAKAIERGLITDQDAVRMSEREIQRQIFAPGFSTASAVTETSGRGVGMDVVLVTIRKLGGSIDIDSVRGEGTKFYLTFPVTAALQRIMVVSDGERELGLPERSIVEIIEVDRDQLQKVGDSTGIHHRDRFLTVQHIESILGWETSSATADQKAFPVVIIGTPQRSTGVAVSKVKRRQEVFMKELHPALNAVDVLAGATVMGEGQPLLILDPETLIAISGA